MFRVTKMGVMIKRGPHLIEDEHSVEPVEGVGVKVLDLAGLPSQASEGGYKISRLHLLKYDNLPPRQPNTH